MKRKRWLVFVLTLILTAIALPSSRAWSPLAVSDDPLVRMPGTQPGQVTLEAPTRCLNCHADYDQTVEPGYHWKGSMMAQAARDFLFWACLTVAGQDSIWAVGTPNAVDICERCHFPKGWLEGRSDPPNASLMTGADYDGVYCDLCHTMYDPFFEATYGGTREGNDWLNYWDETNASDTPSQDAADATYLEDGQLAQDILLFNGNAFYSGTLPLEGYVGNGSGQYFVSSGGEKRAPFADATARHAFFYSRYHKSRYFCSSCHDVSNPVLANLTFAGTPPGDGTTVLPTEENAAYAYYHVERTFSEFMLSAYGQQGGAAGVGPYAPDQFQTSYANNYIAKCQDCHMRDVVGAGADMNDVPVRPTDSVEHPNSGQPLHDLTGGNVWVSRVLASAVPGSPNYDALNEQLLDQGPAALTLDLAQGEGIDPVALLAGADRATQQLQLAAAIDGLSYDPATGDLSFRVQNQTGHKLISGFPEGRRMFINVQVFSGGGLVYEINPYSYITGTLKGLPIAYSSHSPPLGPGEVYADALVYEMHPRSDLTSEDETFHFALATGRYKDNRIPPQGFRIAEAAARLSEPVWHGVSVPDYFTADEYAGGYDAVTLTVPAGADRIEVNLYYQTTSREYIEFLRDEINGVANTLSDPDPGTPGNQAYIIQSDPFFGQLAAWGDTIWQLWNHNMNVPGAMPFLMTSATWQGLAVQAAFTASPTAGIAPLEVTFSNLSIGDYDASLWRFGDGLTSTLDSPSHIYAAAGVYTVSLAVSGPGGSDVLTRTHCITVYQAVQAGFDASPTVGTAPLEVTFSNTSTGDYDASLWHFGDGLTSTLDSPSHIYAAAGVYTVSLAVSGPGGSDVLTRTHYITVYQAVQAGFDASPTVGIAPLEVTFSNTSTGDYDASLWRFGDGLTSTVDSPSHIYAAAGVYTVSLAVSGPGGSDVLTRTHCITVYQAVQAGFDASPTVGTAPLEVTFSNTSTGDYDASLWRFGDGLTSTVDSPSHIYAAAGVYTVSLSVSGPGGSDALTRTDYITVYQAVQAGFDASPTAGIAPLEVTFSNLSIGDYDASLWRFGDGLTSTVDSPSHIYAAAGVYTVSLAVSGPGGSDVLTRTHCITVYHAVQVGFDASPTVGIAPLEVTFSNTSTGDYDASLWRFGDGLTSTLDSPSYIYATAGVYTVSLAVSGPGGSDALTRTHYITAYQAVQAGFDASPTAGIAPLEVTFSNTSTGDYDASLWRFGDGLTSTVDSPSHIYAAAGVYTVSLAVSGPGGSDLLTRTQYIAVYTSLHADFSASPTEGAAPLEVTFTNRSVGDYDASLWRFGDGLTSTLDSPPHIYAAAGVYTVSLAVSGPGGSDALTRTDYITVYQAVQAGFDASPTSGIAPLEVTFSNTSTGDYDASLWRFGDGLTSTLDSPSHIYAAAGVFTVSLAVSGPGGSDALTRTHCITVYQAVQAGFDASPTVGTAPLEVTFSNTSTGDYDASLWRFGDGLTSTLDSPSHIYAAAGVYTVSLAVSGPGGSDTLTRSHYITVGEESRIYLPVVLRAFGEPRNARIADLHWRIRISREAALRP